jgi:signal peptidase I
MKVRAVVGGRGLMNKAHSTVIGVLLLFLLGTGCAKREELHFKITSSSMSPTYEPGDVIGALPYRPDEYTLRRFDVIVFRPPVDQKGVFAFRVIALPLETITITSNGFLINGVDYPKDRIPLHLAKQNWLPPIRSDPTSDLRWDLGRDQVFVIGDNLTNANDSRYWGPVRLADIVAVVDAQEKGRK